MKCAHLTMRGVLGTALCLPPALDPKPGLPRRSSALRRHAAPNHTTREQQQPASAATVQPVPGNEDSLPCTDLCPPEVWWRLEDLWLRLALHMVLKLEEDDRGCRLVITGQRQASEGELGLLCSHAIDAGSYEWRVAHHSGSFAQKIDSEGEDLVCHLVPTCRIASWPEGHDTATLVQGFLGGLRQRQSQAASGRVAA